MLRIERRTDERVGKGVYQYGDSFQLIFLWRDSVGMRYPKDEVSDPSLHPSPEKDGKLKDYWNNLNIREQLNHRFGFENIEQLRRWFFDDDILNKLKEIGFQISIYKTGKTFKAGYTQAVCKWDDMEYVGEFKD